MKSNYQSRIIGLLFVVGGLGFLGEQLGYWDFSIFFSGWWTIFLILPAVFSMIDSGIHLGNSILLCIGVYFLLDANDLIRIRLSFNTMVAILCIIIGIRMIFGMRARKNIQQDDTTNVKNIHSNVFCGTRRFKGTGMINSLDAQCMLGSQLMDLSEADVHNMEFIHLNCVLGNIDLIVPSDMNYVVKKDNVLGSCSIQDEPIGKYDLYVDVSCVLGEVNLRKRKVEQYQEGNFTEK